MEFNDVDMDALIKRKRLEATEALMLGWCKKKGYDTPIRDDKECNEQIKEFCKEFNTTYNYILVEYGKRNDIAIPYKELLKITKEYEPALYHCPCTFYDLDHIDDLIKCIIAEELFIEGLSIDKENSQRKFLVDTTIQ